LANNFEPEAAIVDNDLAIAGRAADYNNFGV